MKDINLAQILLILRARYKVALATLLVVSAVGVAITLLWPRQYVATTDIVFYVKTPDPVMGQLLPVMPGYIATQVKIISSERVSQRVVKMTRLDQNPTLQADWRRDTDGKGSIEAWIARILVKKLAVEASHETSIIRISYTSADPAFAAAIANAFAQAYLDANVELRVDPARQYARWFETRGKTARDNLEQAQTTLSKFQQEHGIVAKDEQYDMETVKLNALTSQLTVAMGETAVAQSKQQSGSDALPDVTTDTVITALRSDIARMEGKLQEAAVNLGSNHPQYQRMENELAALKQQLGVQMQRVTRGYSSTRAVSRDNESELRRAIAAQTSKLLALKSQRNQLAVLQRDVAAAQSAYDTVTARHNQSTLESQMTQADAAVLSYATEPATPAFPGILKGLVMALGAGILLGLGVAFLIELLDRRVRCVDDLVQALPFPVLSVVHRARPGRQSRLLFWRRSPRIGFS